MASPWIPASVGAVWAALFVAVLVIHLRHARALGGRHGLWHISHVLMAAGMAVMFLPTFLPTDRMLVSGLVGTTTFAVAAAVLAALVAVAAVRGVGVGPLWVLSVLDLIWMSYMFAMTSTRLPWLSVLGAAWFGAQAIGWASGRLGRVLEHRGLGVAARVTRPQPLPPARRDTRLATQPDARTELPTKRPADVVVRDGIVDGGPRDWSVRITLTVMGVGMAYMLLSMQFGMAAAAPGMGTMSGM